MIINVLVTGVGATTGISVIKGLRKQKEFNIKITGTDTNDSRMIAGSTFCDRFYKVPKAKDKNYIPKLLDICKKEKIQMLIPIVDPELLVVSNNRKIFEEKGTKVIVSNPDTIAICNDKYLTYEFFKKSGIPTPETWLPENISNYDKLSYPVFVKPRDGISSVNAFRVDSPDELTWANNRIKNLSIQEYLDGKEYTTDVLCDLNCKAIAVVPRERLQTKAGISFKGRTCHDGKLIHWGKKIAETLKIAGPANIQCIVNGDKISYFEVNPRFSGSLPLTIASGVNSPYLLLKILNGEKTPNKLLNYKIVTMARYWQEIFYEK